MRLITLCLLALLVACGRDDIADTTGSEATIDFSPANQQEKWKADTAMYLYQTLAKYNFDYSAKHYVSDPESVLMLKEGWSLMA